MTYTIFRHGRRSSSSSTGRRHELEQSSILAVQSGTILQLRNAGDEELVLFIYGAPPVTGRGEFFPDVAS